MNTKNDDIKPIVQSLARSLDIVNEAPQVAGGNTYGGSVDTGFTETLTETGGGGDTHNGTSAAIHTETYS